MFPESLIHLADVLSAQVRAYRRRAKRLEGA
jgi:hypothetical protein